MAADRSTTLMSDTLLEDAGIVPAPVSLSGRASPLTPSASPSSPTPLPLRPDSRNVVILPKMMNQYQSLLSTHQQRGVVTNAIALHQAAPSTTTTLQSIMNGTNVITKPFFTALENFHHVQAGYAGHHGLLGALAEATATYALPLCATEARLAETERAAAAFLKSRKLGPLSQVTLFSLRELSGVDKLSVGSVVTCGTGGTTGYAGGRSYQGHQDAVSIKDGPVLPLEVDDTAPPSADHRLSNPTLLDLKYILARWGQRWASEREVIHAKHQAASQHIGKSTAMTVTDLLASIQYNSQVQMNKPARSLLDFEFDEAAHEAATQAVTEQAQMVVLADTTLRFTRRLESLPMYGEPAS